MLVMLIRILDGSIHTVKKNMLMILIHILDGSIHTVKRNSETLVVASQEVRLE
jgi:hypothetical protein